MSSVSSTSSQPERYTGLASGIDVDTIVSKLMQAENIPLDQLKQKQQIMQWQEEQYRELNSQVLSLQNLAFTMKLQSSYQQYTASSSNESILSASASSLAGLTSYTFNQITSLAQASNIATADGTSISRKTSVMTGKTAVATSIDANTANTFQLNYNGSGFVNVSLATGKTYGGITPGNTLNDFVSDLQSAVDSALSVQGVASGTVKVTLTKNNTIQFTTNDAGGGTPATLALKSGTTNDLLAGGLGFQLDATTGQVSSVVQNIDLDQSIYTNLQQGRFGNTTDFGWLVNGSYSSTLGSDTSSIVAGDATTGVDYNNTNISNYSVTTTEEQNISLPGAADNTVTTLNYNSANYNNLSVTVNGTKYTVVNNVAQSDLKTNQVSISDDGNGKMKLTFSGQLDAGTNIQAVQKTTYGIVSDVASSDLTPGQALLTQDSVTGKAQFTFKNQLAAGTQVSVDRHDFSFSTAVYNQDGSVSNVDYNVNAMTETMNSLMNKINTSSSSGLKAFYDSGTDKMIFNAAQTGENNTLGNDISLSGSFLTNALQLTKYSDGNDAVFTINGLATTRKSNSFTINGVTFNLKGTTGSSNPVTVNTAINVDKVFDNIKAFVDQYNTTIEAINDKLSQTRDYDYPPLTDAQKKAMSDADVEKWNEKAQEGLLAGDNMLQSIVDNMRRAFYDTITSTGDSNYKQLSQIGIKTSSTYKDNGKLIIDEGVLKNAIAKDPDKVMAMFTNTSTATDATQNYNETGLAARINSITKVGISNITAKAGTKDSYSVYDSSSLGLQMTDLANEIYDLQDMLNDKETAYYRQFTNMETALSNMNAQSQWLTAQLGKSS